jgi:hypothetical protein
VGADKPAPPSLLSLIPDEQVRTDALEAAVRAVVEAFELTGELTGAVSTLLHRTPPRILNQRPGAPVVPPGVAPGEAVAHAVLHLEGSTLAIQGPPGSGKTTAAARAIVDLIRGGFRVGVTSNGHKAIEKLMQCVLEEADGTPIRAIKIKREADDDIVTSGLARHASSMRSVNLAAESGGGAGGDPPDLVGGTAWAFCHDAAIGAFDYLFVDEASQVSLANVVGMSRAARNIVLLGDQMQLAQPLKGSHPGESGQSALGYLLGDHRTIPVELGIFLGTSWRMHPDVCRVVSEVVYEARLTADPANARRVVTVPAKGAHHVRTSAGVVFVPAVHEGNAQGSEEDVDLVAEIIDELLGRELVEKADADKPPSSASRRRGRRRRRVTEADILVVAPYNLQVRALRAALPEGVRVGTVDKFQGQEAPIAIVSMCASSADCIPRGIEFLFSTNRMNVAISRAQSLAIVVGSPALAHARVRTVEQMKLVNFYCRVAGEQS